MEHKMVVMATGAGCLATETLNLHFKIGYFKN